MKMRIGNWRWCLKLGSLCLALSFGLMAGGCKANKYERTVDTTQEDRATTEAVKRTLAGAKSYESVIVTTSQGVVRLGGFVETAAQKEQATQLINPIRGVKSVDNQIHVQ